MQEHPRSLDNLRVAVCELVPGSSRDAAVKDGGKGLVHLAEGPVRDLVRPFADDGLANGVGPLQEEGTLPELPLERLKAFQGSAVSAPAEIWGDPEEERFRTTEGLNGGIECLDVIDRADHRVECFPGQGVDTAGLNPGFGAGSVDLDDEHVPGALFAEIGGFHRARVYCTPEDPVAVPVAEREVVKPAPFRAIAGYREVHGARQDVEGPMRDADADPVVVLSVRDPCCRIKAALLLGERARIEGDAVVEAVLLRLAKQGDVGADPFPGIPVPDAPRHHGVVVARQDVDRDWVEPVKDIDRPLHGGVVHAVILKRVAGEEHEIDILLLREFDDAAGRLESLLPDFLCFFTGMSSFHADLPIGCM